MSEDLPKLLPVDHPLYDTYAKSVDEFSRSHAPRLPLLLAAANFTSFVLGIGALWLGIAYTSWLNFLIVGFGALCVWGWPDEIRQAYKKAYFAYHQKQKQFMEEMTRKAYDLHEGNIVKAEIAQMACVAAAQGEKARAEHAQVQAELEREIAAQDRADTLAASVKVIKEAVRALGPEKDNATMLSLIDEELTKLSSDADMRALVHDDTDALNALTLARQVISDTCGTDPFLEQLFEKIMARPTRSSPELVVANPMDQTGS